METVQPRHLWQLSPKGRERLRIAAAIASGAVNQADVAQRLGVRPRQVAAELEQLRRELNEIAAADQ